MRLSIKYKLLLTILSTICLVVISIHLIGQWSFQRGFMRFVNTTEQARLEQLATDLKSSYAAEDSWDFLRDKPAHWMTLLRGSQPGRAIDPRHDDRLDKRFKNGPKPRPHNPQPEQLRRFEGRVALLDAGHEVIFGFPHLFEDIEFKPLNFEGAIVGYLGLAPQKQLGDTLQLQFVKQQKSTFALIAMGMVLLATLLTLPMANRMVRPIKTLAAATRELTSGNYKARTPVTSQDELGQLSHDFNVLATTLEQNEQARQQWVADISHELRTPLAILRGEIEALQDQVREVTPQSLEALHGEVMQLNRLINDLYELSMSDLGALTYKKELIDPNNVLQKIVDLYRPRLEASGLTLDVDTAAERIQLLADHDRLQQLFSNLLENSLRYTEAGGRIEISTAIESGHMVYNLQDTAPGVSETELARLFDRLYRVESSRNRSVGGAGLGLSICKNIVEAHGGTIEAKPSPLGGLWLQIRLPLKG